MLLLLKINIKNLLTHHKKVCFRHTHPKFQVKVSCRTKIHFQVYLEIESSGGKNS